MAKAVSVAASLFSIALYCSTSVGMTVTNKWVVSTWGFKYNGTILLGQMLFSMLVLTTMSWVGTLKIATMTKEVMPIMIPLALCYVANVTCALTALRLTSVPVYNVLKRMAPLPVMVTDFAIRGQRFSSPIRQSVFIIVFGAILCGGGDLDMDMLGYFLACLSCVLQAVYLVYCSKAGDRGLNSSEIMYWNSVLLIPLLLFWAVWELPELQKFEYFSSLTFQACLVACLTMGSLLNYAIFLCTTTNSALTTVIVGQLKGLISTILGFMLFGKVHITMLGAVGIVLNTSGGGLYTWIKWDEKRKAKESDQEETLTNADSEERK